MSAKVLAHRRGWSSGDSEPAAPAPPPPTKRAYPRITRPVFNGVGEMRAFENAWASTARKPGEDPADHMDRVVAAARAAMGREPGQEG